MNDNETADEKRLRRIAAARAELARRYAEDPDAVKRFEARKANIEAVRRRERQRVQQLSTIERPADVDLERPLGISRQDWKIERSRRQREHRDAMNAWNASRGKAKPSAPTPEQAAKATFVEMTVNDHVNGRRVKIGRAHCRQARFEEIGGLSPDQLGKLRRYRRAFDTSEISPVKSWLDMGDGGGMGGSDAALSRLEAIAFADIVVTRMEATVPAHLRSTLRSVALHDASFTDVASSRFGGSSGKQRARVRSDFIEAVDALMAHITAPTSASAVAGNDQSTPADAPHVDPSFLDDRGYMLPLDEVAAIIIENWLGEVDVAVEQ